MEYFVIMNRTVGEYVSVSRSGTSRYSSLASAERYNSASGAHAHLGPGETVVRVTTGDLGTRNMQVPTCKLELV